ncbi:trans-sulfuration enzyme family member [Holotrichia oblita]|uniref:Trans-sulfuration enzyme family member n=1 Tax=Holotrichia oblita TaxID=644536 RepID=A0ACB9T567_HOLOL|nr:trans-sulfuration enzyme family member [Holotrichia oblita]
MSENSGYLPEPKGFSTKAIHSATDPDKWDSMCVVPPLVLSTTYKQIAPGQIKEFKYGRGGNPSRNVLEGSLRALENAEYAITFASGLGALTALINCHSRGDHFVVGDDMYGGNFRLLDKVGKNLGIDISIVDASNLDNVKNAMKPNTKLVFIETPTNPLLKVFDIRAIAEIAKNNNALFCVDNTFLTPFFQRPLELGADLSSYSLTKYMNGHTDVIMGAIVTNNKELHDKLRFLQNRLESHPHHALMKKQTSGHSGIMSMYIDGERKEGEKFLKELKIFTLAESLGGYESLAEIPSIMTHASIPEEIRKELKITDNLIRLSVGLEDTEDLINDLKHALDVIKYKAKFRLHKIMAENTGYLPIPKGFTTKAIHSSTDPDRWDSMCIVPPLVLSATFKHVKLGEYKYEYGRAGNPSRDVLEGSLSAIENAKYAVTFASGLGALTAIINCYTQGDHFVVGDDMYGGNYRLFEKVAKNLGVEITMVDATLIDNVKNAIKPNTKLIFIETPTNPLLKVFDIKAIAEIAKNNNALFCVDNTFLTPYFQRPLELGADLSSYSLTKYMNGHTDVIMGAVVTNNKEMHDKLRFLQNGLESHPNHALTKQQTSGHSGIMSMYIDGGRKESENFLKAIKLFIMAESLGGYESLAEIPSIMTHASLPAELLKELNITDNMIRLSVGLEDPEDLINDLDQALNAM